MGVRALALVCLIAGSVAFLPYQNPPWPARYAMNLSTISMACNISDWYNATIGAQFGIVSYDWSNAKHLWANTKPMDCIERMVKQAEMTKALNPTSKVFVYRNLVKALPWFTAVREKLEDPSYSGFFLKFKIGGAFPNGSYHVPQCTGSKCSEFYHDQEQTPEQPAQCVDECDCGTQPCGEYLFDHRNGTMLRDWLVNEVIGTNSVGNPNIDGLFIDDFWCSNLLNHSCSDPVQGPTEIDRNSQADMGLSDQDILDITNGWLETMTAVQDAIVRHNGYTWSLLPGQANANASPLMISTENCARVIRSSCETTSLWQSAPLVMGLSSNDNGHTLSALEQDLAAFLLMRGPHAYLGFGAWGMSWPVGVAWTNNTNELPFPVEFNMDYGVPVDVCHESSPNVFTRDWTRASVALDCNSWKATIQMKA